MLGKHAKKRTRSRITQVTFRKKEPLSYYESAYVAIISIAVLFMMVLIAFVFLIQSFADEMTDETMTNAPLITLPEDTLFDDTSRPFLPEEAPKEASAEIELMAGDSILLDVVLFNQLEPDSENPIGLYNGCEVTSMAMLLAHAGLAVEKKDVARVVAKVPFYYDDGVTRGNPHHGFVGSMSTAGGQPGYSVYHGPIVDAAETFLEQSDLSVVDLTSSEFETILKEVKAGNPVWVITTGSLAPTDRWETWQTPDGAIDITWAVHSVVITGFNDDVVYVNNPYGTKDQEADRTLFQAAWEQLGSQAVVVRP